MPASKLFPWILISVLVAISSAQTTQPQVVDLKAGDGTLLKATYFAAGKAGPGVLLLHQCNQQRKLWDPLAAALNSVGINVLTIDYRGFGESGGPRYDKLTPEETRKVVTETWPGDIDVAYQYLFSQPGVQHDKIGAGGASCGVNNSIQLARRHPEVKSLMLLSGPTDRNGRLFLQKPNALPIFAGSADDDVFADSTVTMQWLFSVSPNPASRFQDYRTGGHGAEMFAPHPEFPAMIARWFQATLTDMGTLPSTDGTPLPSAQIQTLAIIDQPGGASKAAQTLNEARQRDPKATVSPEFIVNLLGYEHLQMGDTKGAVEIMQLNATSYPDSPNVYDSLSDACLANGEKDLALANAKKTLVALANDKVDDEARRKAIRESAEAKIRQLDHDPAH